MPASSGTTTSGGTSSSPRGNGAGTTPGPSPSPPAFATRLGAWEAALGTLYAGVLEIADVWRALSVAAGTRSGAPAWPLRFHRRFRRYTDSAFADLKNSSIRMQAIPAYAAEFLK